jgi:hypothetical protein
MAYGSKYNVDRRAKDENVHVARGFRGSAIELVIANGETIQVENFEANGKMVGLIVIHPANGTATLTVEIFPVDMQNAEALVYSKAGLAQAKDHYVDVQDSTSNNTPIYLFGFHAMKVTSSAAVGAETTITVVPILARH